ncbi:jg23266, partial [Pararge aegeria aegeria]
LFFIAVIACLCAAYALAFPFQPEVGQYDPPPYGDIGRSVPQPGQSYGWDRSAHVRSAP